MRIDIYKTVFGSDEYNTSEYVEVNCDVRSQDKQFNVTSYISLEDIEYYIDSHLGEDTEIGLVKEIAQTLTETYSIKDFCSSIEFFLYLNSMPSMQGDRIKRLFLSKIENHFTSFIDFCFKTNSLNTSILP